MFSILLRSLWYDRWINLAVGFGVVCAAAVLTGALLVGDSMRGSLKALTLDRLGTIDSILFAPGFVEYPSPHPNPPPGGEGTIEESQSKDCGSATLASSAVILLPAAVEFNGKICGVQLLGQGTTCIANQALAEKIELQVDETVSLRLMPPQSIPPESSLGRKDQLLRTRIAVEKIIPNKGIGRFSLKTDTQAEPLLIVPLDWLQQRLDMPDKVNAILFHSDSPEHVLTQQARETLLNETFQPTLADLGIVVEDHGGKVYIKSTRMLFTDEQEIAVHNDSETRSAIKTPTWSTLLTSPISQKGLLYLATSISANNKATPYSTIYAVQDKELPLAENEIALNQWTADDLGVTIGSKIELTWFDPDNVAEAHSQTFSLAKILPMEGLGADPHVVPTVQGFTDETSIADWDPPFPFDAKKIRQKDEEYWDMYRAAPKAFVSLETGQKLFGSRFGKVTTFVIDKLHFLYADELVPTPSEGNELNVPPPFDGNLDNLPSPSAEEFEKILNLWKKEFLDNLSKEDFGINLVPVKEQGLAASSGTTPFSILFLCFSFFIITSALMLVMMLFRLSVEMKAKRIGIQLAVGWSAGLITKTLLAEGLVIALLGSFFGALLGIGYAAVMIYGLTTWWVDAVTVPFITLYITPLSLLIGFISGMVLALLTILWSIRGITKIPVRALLFSVRDASTSLRKSPLPFASLAGFSRSNAARNRTRSILCVALIASTTFLVLSISAFRLDSKEQSIGHLRGSGGYSFIAETAFPVYADIRTAEGREKLSLQTDDEKFLQTQRFGQQNSVLSMRAKEGDSASCLNLYQSNKPRILGMPLTFSEERTRFIFAQNVNGTDQEALTWQPLWKPITTDVDGVRRVPIILDANTAQYSLHLYGGVGDVYEYEDEVVGTIRCEIVGLLSNSVLQGEILMSEENLLELFPDTGGYRFFLFEQFDERTSKIMYDLLGDYGFQGEPTTDRLRKLFAIQNTYLSTFQSLGGIGLLLGIFGLAVIQSRNVLERRKELALLQAMGFSKGRTILLLLYESFWLLFWGLFWAAAASCIVLIIVPLIMETTQPVSATAVLRQFIVLVGSLLFVGFVANVASALAVLKIPAARELAEER